LPEPTHQPNLPDILLEAPTPPRRSRSFYASLVLAVLVLGWSIHGAKIRPGELLDGIPQIFLTLGRMFPPDFSKITDSKNYFLPETLSWRDLLLPLPTAGEQARARQRWWDNTFPQTVIGATLETVQMALAGTFLALLVAFPWVSRSPQYHAASVCLLWRALVLKPGAHHPRSRSRTSIRRRRRFGRLCRHAGVGRPHRHRAG
jgi:ABC-type phosphate/phosphonate transport system permease subunit